MGMGALPLASQAAEDSFYAGGALVNSGYVVDDGDFTKERDTSTTSVGVYVGYKQFLSGGFFGAGEAFYHDTSQSNSYGNGDRVNVESQYGIKGHLGYEWNSGFSLYGIAGVANLEYDVRLNDEKADNSGFSAIYGAGAAYRINQQLSTNFEVISASDEIDIAGDKDKSASLMSLRLGVSYHF
ncbi:hypothetical protein ADIMK_2908 [Marinobacterium lacunae]|uniref:Outer membrane protein beta-barrel domain-containing protein n=2 Tax=Marinobacterium lacunae TaxID=1232683 RepID=A0A081FWN3_9GAMM|nr:hypothetical protein ADIMK_2908 [Marinobacterium lacunae]